MCCYDESLQYADDTVLVYVGTSSEMFIEYVNSRLREKIEQFNCNKLSWNPAKSEFMIVTSKIVVNHPQSLLVLIR